MMRAKQIRGDTPPYRLEAVELPCPTPGPGEVLVRVSHVGVNRADLFQLEGSYPLPEEAAMVPGLEVSGTIAALGEGVTGYCEGDAVCALLTGGGYAEYCVAPAGQVLPVPAGLTMVQASALPEALATGWLALFRTAGLQAGETLLVHGGSSGIGTAAIQLARLAGARVLVTAGTPEKCAACRELGAEAINYREADFVEAVKQETEGRGVDVLLDMVGGAYVSRNLRALATGGRMVSIAFLDGAKTEVNLAGLLMKNLTWSGVTLRSRPKEEKAAIMQALQARIWPEIEKGAYRPVLDRVFSLEDAEKAHQHMREGLHIGKIVLEVAAE